MITRLWLHGMTTIARWMAHRYLSTEVDVHHRIITRTWYPFVVQQVRKAQLTHSRGADKRDFVVAACRARFQAKQLTCPPLHDLHLALEYAVRDHAH